MTSKACQCCNKMLQPFVNVALKLENRAIRKTSALEGAVAQQVAAHDLAGTDAAQASTRRFVAEQQAMINYRIARFFHEGRYVLNGEYFKGYDYKSFIVDLRMVTKVLFLYIIFRLWARGSVFQPITPDSPFAESLKFKANPNY